VFSHASERRCYATQELLTLPNRKESCVLGRRDLQDLAWPLIVAGNAGADTQVGASFDEQRANFGIGSHEMSQRVKDRRLAAHTGFVHLGARIDISPAIQKEPRGIDEAVFRGHVEEGGATQREQATPRPAAIGQFAVTAMDERRVGVERGGQLAHTAAKDREDSGNVVARVGTSGQKEFNAGGETTGIARVCLNT